MPTQKNRGPFKKPHTNKWVASGQIDTITPNYSNGPCLENKGCAIELGKGAILVLDLIASHADLSIQKKCLVHRQ